MTTEKTNERIPVTSREELLTLIQELPPGTEVSFSGLKLVEFIETCQDPYRVKAVFDPPVSRKASGEVVVENH